MFHLKFTHKDSLYLIAQTDDGKWTFSAHDTAIVITPDMDLVEEFENNTVAWAQYIDEQMIDAGAIVYDEDHGYITHEDLEEAANEALYYADHIRQESRSDLFI